MSKTILFLVLCLTTAFSATITVDTSTEKTTNSAVKPIPTPVYFSGNYVSTRFGINVKFSND